MTTAPELRHPDPALTDGVIVLRAVREADIPQIVEACADPLVKRFTSSIPDPYSEDDARTWLATHREDEASGTEINFCIADAADDARLLGMTGLHDFSWRNRRAATGYWIAPWARRQGHATRATRLLADHALTTLGLARVELIADIDNTPSQKVAEHAGFIREGTLHRHTLMAGELRDCAIYGRLA
jgi:RimJ/RimL family protein N-acetyltransferase